MEQVPDVLARADGAASLPRLGGMARADGVMIVSGRYWALARRDGTLEEGRMPAPPGLVTRIPVLRGLARLGLAFAPLVRSRATRRKGERGILLAAIGMPIALALLPASLQLPIGLLLMAVLVTWLFRGRTLFLHGAEHRAIAAAEQSRLGATWSGAVRPSRFSRRCGTNFAWLATAATLVLYALVPVARDAVWSLPLGLATLGLTMELWFLIQAAPARAGALLLAPGLALQRLTTREPSLEETRVALRAVASVVARELAPAEPLHA